MFALRVAAFFLVAIGQWSTVSAQCSQSLVDDYVSCVSSSSPCPCGNCESNPITSTNAIVVDSLSSCSDVQRIFCPLVRCCSACESAAYALYQCTASQLSQQRLGESCLLSCHAFPFEDTCSTSQPSSTMAPTLTETIASTSTGTASSTMTETIASTSTGTASSTMTETIVSTSTGTASSTATETLVSTSTGTASSSAAGSADSSIVSNSTGTTSSPTPGPTVTSPGSTASPTAAVTTTANGASDSPSVSATVRTTTTSVANTTDAPSPAVINATMMPSGVRVASSVPTLVKLTSTAAPSGDGTTSIASSQSDMPSSSPLFVPTDRGVAALEGGSSGASILSTMGPMVVLAISSLALVL